MTTLATVLGFPRIGDRRALKRATEAYWAGAVSAPHLLETAASIRRQNWRALHEAGVDEVPCNDFSLYDHMLDTAVLFGALPARHRHRVDPRLPEDEIGDDVLLRRYFAAARGTDVAAPLEMSKRFDTNYHYLIPELEPGARLSLNARKPMTELSEARALGLSARPVVVGPITFLALSKASADAPTDWSTWDLLDELIPLYGGLLAQLRSAGAEWVQLDEPALATDLPSSVLESAEDAYERICAVPSRPNLLVASYFDRVGEAMPFLREAPIEGVALDFTGPARANIDDLRAVGGLPGKRLVAGVVDGRNVWVTDLRSALETLDELRPLAAEVCVSSSCSLSHVPLDVELETGVDPHLAQWLAFAKQKVAEVVALARGMAMGPESIALRLQQNDAKLSAWRAAPAANVAAVRQRVESIAPGDDRRAAGYGERERLQADALRLPVLPTTTIGSFPQTKDIRAARAACRDGTLTTAEYEERMRDEIAHVIAVQEEIGLDVLVHGEPERADMVQYFAERLDGVLSTEHGWVQSYGTRYVRPPIIVGDVSRPGPMTISWWRHAQSLTTHPVKAMLTGPITLLRWSFPRVDVAPSETATQLALAIRDEIAELEAAGAQVIQVDEPALREGLPLRAVDRPDYLSWAARAFRLTTSGVRPTTQIHTHMCYAEFGDILDAVVALDADVISLEAARSGMRVVDELAERGYPAAVGPGVYDIHSSRVPSVEELRAMLSKVVAALPAQRVWVNPDCGLKTRSESEVVPALRNLVAAARLMRAAVG
jgi:5-methyltetrahydropteroyltriglutamate--homocysteine methyltransferase